MISFEMACEKAYNELVSRDYQKGFLGVLDVGDKWIFIGSYFPIEDEIVDYDNAPVAILKESGEEIPYSIHNNIVECRNGKDVEFPKKYRLR